MIGLLAFEDAPPFSVPARFFATAPWYGVAAGGLIVLQGADLLVSRWSPAVLALTHLLALGFLLQVMLGALFQFLPVAAGAGIKDARRWAAVIHPVLNLGVLLLCAGFLVAHSGMLVAAGVMLCLAIGGFLVAALRALLPRPNTSPTIPALKLALFGLALTLMFGLALLAVYALGWRADPAMLTAIHVAWGVLGWSAVLVTGVSLVVVPMFQLTPGYRARFSRLLAPALAAGLMLWSGVQAGVDGAGLAWPNRVVGAFLILLVLAYAITTLRLQAQSKRPRADATAIFWRMGMVLSLLGAVVWGAILLGVDFGGDRGAMLLGVLAFPGALTSVVSGMMYKIVPFLCWLHTQNRVTQTGMGKAPHMGSFLPEAAMRWHWQMHLVALALLLLGLVWPPLLSFAGAALALSYALLGANMLRALRRFQQTTEGRVP